MPLMHNQKCLAHAMINAIENLRDVEDQTPIAFYDALADNIAFEWAIDYLNSGTVTCICHV